MAFWCANIGGVSHAHSFFLGWCNVPWILQCLFLNALSECSSSLISNANLISKGYFPRLVVPASAVIVSFVEFMILGIILLGLMAWYDFVPS